VASPRSWLCVASIALLGLVAGCGAGGDPTRTPAPSPSATSGPVVSIPSDGVRLAAFGYRNGPVEAFSLPTAAVLQAAVDQPNNVSAVLSRPAPAEIYAYLLRTLPTAGFTISGADQAAVTMTFTGQGWQGSFTGEAGTSAVLLRPG
jgi:hypothetical protein